MTTHKELITAIREIFGTKTSEDLQGYNEEGSNGTFFVCLVEGR